MTPQLGLSSRGAPSLPTTVIPRYCDAHPRAERVVGLSPTTCGAKGRSKRDAPPRAERVPARMHAVGCCECRCGDLQVPLWDTASRMLSVLRIFGPEKLEKLYKFVVQTRRYTGVRRIREVIQLCGAFELYRYAANSRSCTCMRRILRLPTLACASGPRGA